VIERIAMSEISSSLKRNLVLSLFLATWTSLASAREVTACGHHDYPPWNWMRGNEIVGSCADVTRNVFERLGHTVKLAYVGPWKRCQALIEAGEVDVNICSFRNPEREAYSRFVGVPMGNNPIGVFVKKGREFPFEKWRDLTGKRSGVVNGVSMGAEFDTFLATQTILERAIDPVLNLRKLEADRIDFTPIGVEAGLLQIKLYGFEGGIVPLPHPALEGKLYISISNKATDLHKQIPDIEKYLSRPEYPQELSKKNALHREQYVREVMTTSRGNRN
jgi:polar amino acid transport system substrate-binding protein